MRVSFVFGVIASSAFVNASMPRYSVEALPKVAGVAYFDPFGLNDAGTVAGRYNNQPSIYENGHIVAITGLGTPVSINNAGYLGSDPGDQYTPSRLKKLPYSSPAITLAPQSPYPASITTRVTNNNRVAGLSWASNSGFYASQATIWDFDGRVVGAVPGRSGFASSWFHDMNDQGVALGMYGDEYIDRDGQAFLYRNGQVEILDGMYAGRAINNLGDVAGYDFSTRGFILKNGVKNYLPKEKSTDRWIKPEYMNDRGTVAGYITRSNFVETAFLYQDGETVEMSKLFNNIPASAYVPYIRGMNQRGQIIGYLDAPIAMGGSYFFLATPVPEPTSLLALGAGLGVLIRRRKNARPNL